MLRRLFLAALLPLFCGSQLNAQSEWQYYTFASALNSIAEEGDYLWLATDNGLVKFDKRTYAKEIFTRANSGLPSVYVSSVAVDHDGVKWAATRKGLVRFDNTDWRTFDESNLSDISTLFVDHGNALWVVMRQELACYNNGGWVSTPSPRVLPSLIRAIHETEDNKIMLSGFRSGSRSALLYEVHPETAFLTERTVGDGNTGMVINAAVYHNGNLWLAGDCNANSNDDYSAGKVVWSHGTNVRTFLHTDIGFPEHASFTSISLDSAGNIWVGDAYGQGASRFDGSTWKVFDHTNSPIEQDSRVNAIMTDRDGVVWIATSRNGLVRFDGTTWRSFTTADLTVPNPSIPPSVTALAIDDRQNIHIGCDGGYGVFDGTQIHWDEQTTSDFLVGSLAVDHQGTTWIVGNIGLNTTPVSPLSYVDIGEQNAHCVLTGKNGTVWIGTEKGVTACDHMIQTHFTPSNSGMLSHCTAIAEAPDGTMWFGTENGVVRYDGKTWTHFTASEFPALRDVVPGTMAFDSTGTLWIGHKQLRGYTLTRGNALVKFDGKDWTGYSALSDSFPLYTVSALVTDKNGLLWLAALPQTLTGRPAEKDRGGLARFDGREWNTWSYSDKSSPLPSPLVTSLVVDANNDLWAGTETGLLRYRSHSVITSAGESVRETFSSLLGQNKPNPASAQTTITYDIPENMAQQHVQLTVFNTLGEVLATLVNGYQSQGSYSIDFNTGSLPPGVYHYQLKVGSTTISKQMIIIR